MEKVNDLGKIFIILWENWPDEFKALLAICFAIFCIFIVLVVGTVFLSEDYYLY